ncbi:hypothetical protein L1049_005677 [Liquidambar formosana]|uniref:MBD domain-containing protein n=1 Tax=Liquidambar formosana TaxID=63359 RepID=A0AAP0WRX8_LIQFO
MVAMTSPDWLPAGWTVQYKVQKSGRKVRYYTNSKTGQKFYSKKDVIRYVKMGTSRCDMPRPINRRINRRSRNKHMQLLVKTDEYPEWLPNGWKVELKARNSGSRMGQNYKCYIDPSTGCRFYSKPQVFQYLKTVKHNDYTSKQKKTGTGLHSASNVPQYLKNTKRNSCTSKQKKIGVGMPATNVVVEKVVPNGLPPGWMLEIKIKKSTDENRRDRRDPYYTDPVSGYVFRSRKDVLRYLETGEISRYAFKPKKTGTNDQDSINNEISPPVAAKRQKLTQHTTRRRLFSGKGSSDMSGLALPEAEGSMKRIGEMLSVETRHTSSPTTEIVQEKHSLESATGCAETKENSEPSSSVIPKARGSKRKRGERASDETSHTSVPTTEILQEKHSLESATECAETKGNATECAETKGNSDPSNLVLPKARGSKRKQGERVSDENKPVSTPAAEILQENKLLENGIGNHSDRKTQNGSIKSKKKKELTFPQRSSKRLAGLEPELVANSGFSERALRVAARKSGESEAFPVLGLALDSVAHRASQQLEAQPEPELENNAFRGMEAPLDEDPSNKSKKPLQEDQAVPVRQPGNLEPEKVAEPQVCFPFGDFWSDPCLEFAFKTLTGAIPVEDNLEIQGYFQQLDTPLVKRDGGLTLPDFGLPSYFQSDVSSHFDAPETPVSRQQLPVNPSLLAPGNVSLSSYSGIGPQKPSLQVNKNDQSKVH